MLKRISERRKSIVSLSARARLIIVKWQASNDKFESVPWHGCGKYWMSVALMKVIWNIIVVLSELSSNIHPSYIDAATSIASVSRKYVYLSLSFIVDRIRSKRSKTGWILKLVWQTICRSLLSFSSSGWFTHPCDNFRWLPPCWWFNHRRETFPRRGGVWRIVRRNKGTVHWIYSAFKYWCSTAESHSLIIIVVWFFISELIFVGVILISMLFLLAA